MPGLGKSAQAIVAADQIGANRILIVCPASVRINWGREFQKFSSRNRPVTVVLSSDEIPPSVGPIHILICSYDLATQNLPRILALGRWDVLIPDEIHFCKSTTAQRAHAILAKGGLIHQAGRIWALSGTPAPNHLAETWPLLRAYGVYRNGYDAFVSQFCKTRHTPYGRVICGNQNIPQFRALIAPIILRRKKEEVMRDLPPILFSDVTVAAGSVDREILFPEFFIWNRAKEFEETLAKQRAALTMAFDLIGGGTAGLKALEAFGRDEHKISTFRRYTGIQKIAPVVDLVKDELNSGLNKIVLFAVHMNVIDGLREGLKEFGAVTLYGRTAPERRQRNIDKFQRNPKCRVFIGNIQAAGVGITLTAANQVMMVEQDWVPGNNAQAVMRVHRIGQTLPVTVRTVLLEDDELDRRIQAALKRKTKELVAAFD